MDDERREQRRPSQPRGRKNAQRRESQKQPRPRGEKNREAARAQNKAAPRRREAERPNEQRRTERHPPTQKRRAAAPEKRTEKKQRDSLAAKQAAQRREERRERDSRAAQAVRQRKEERKERARLDETRKKQKRQARHRTRRRISPDTWKRLLIMGGVVVAVILSMVIFFRVHDIEVVGNSYYSPEEIVQAAGVAEGDNLLTVSRGRVAGNVMAQLPYVRSVRVTRKLPNALVLTLTEYDTTYAVQDTAGMWYLITAGGKVTESVSERDAKAHVQVNDLTIVTPVIGEDLTVFSADEEDKLAAEGQRRALLMLLQELEDADLVKEVASVSVPSSFNLSIWYGDRFLVNFGDTDRLDYKFEYLKAVIERQKEYASGTIDLTLREDESAHIMLDD